MAWSIRANKDNNDADYPFYMSCAATGDETTVVSDLDAKALGASITKGDVPTFSYLLDDEKPDDSAGELADIRFDEMGGVWQYIVNGADYDLLLTASKIRIAGVGVDLTLPTDRHGDVRCRASRMPATRWSPAATTAKATATAAISGQAADRSMPDGDGALDSRTETTVPCPTFERMRMRPP